MKNICFLLSASLLIASCGPTTVIQSDNYQPAPAPVVEVSYQSFYDQLTPYGTWVKYPGYGYVWMPNAGPDFRPYATNGNWVYTDAGWTWASNYNWGWAPFHYGRWFFENGYGWIWIPGNEWAPAWVSWRGGGDYYGWAPLGPGISVDMALNNYTPPAYYWNFVPRQYVGNPGWHNYYVNQSRNVTIINNTTIINNYSGTNRTRYAYAPGPDPVEVRRVSGNNFSPVQLREANSPGERISGNEYMIYHPRVNNTTATRNDVAGRPSGPAPARYEAFNNVRPSSQYRVNDAAPANNQPATNPRPAAQPPVNNQPGNNSRPVAQPPVNNQPVIDPRRAGQPPVNNQPVNNTVPQNRNGDAGYTNPPAGRDLNKTRADHLTQTQDGARPVQSNSPARATTVNPAQNTGRSATANPTQTTSRNATANPAQTTGRNATANPQQTNGRAATVHNPNDGHPVQRSADPENKQTTNTQTKPAEPPKTREANN